MRCCGRRRSGTGTTSTKRRRHRSRLGQFPRCRRAGQGVQREQLIVLGAAPARDIAGISPGVVAVVLADPLVEAHWEAAARAVAERGARLRLRWRGRQNARPH